MATDTLPDTGFFDKHRAKIAVAGPDECWLWAAAVDRAGYGAVRARGKRRLAHREAYESENGPSSADGLVVRHKCDTPACVNPGHLEIGTMADNSRDMVERGRHRCGVHKGETNGNAKLTEVDVLAIRTAYVPGSRTHGQPALARQFDVHHSIIGDIVSRKLWGHVL